MRIPYAARAIPLALALAAAPGAWADEPTSRWPQRIESGDWAVTLYQPQIDDFENDTIEARAAVSVQRADGGGEPVFGAVWLSAKVDVDRDARTMTVRTLKVPDVRFADSEAAHRDALAKLLETELPKWDLTLDLDQFLAAFDGVDDAATTPGLKSDPPRFVLSKEPAVLLLYDGEPRTEALENAAGYERAVNTPFPVVRPKGGRTFYLYGGDPYWYSASDAKGPWTATNDVPAGIRKLFEGIEAPEGFVETTAGTPPPKIVVATEPTELIVTQGEPSWAPVGSLDLLYLDNSDSDVFLDLATQRYYVLAAGRWFAGRSVEDEFVWRNVPNDELPDAFADIPPDSPNGGVLAHVAGTVQAREEALQNTVPQTAAVRRDDASFQASYDGEPKFEPVEGVAEVRYAVNTTGSVFLVDGRYWACDNAIWYVAGSPNGPWSVATEIPASLYRIPTSNPHHNVTYVRIYETTPQVVYVGYTPGYVGSYWYRGCVVWGTGWYYDPWYGPRYYPRPWTWGLNVRYDPWYGWGFGVTWSNGPFSISFGWGGGYRHPWYGHGWGGWYGPGGYRPPYYRPYPPPGYHKPRPIPYAGAGGARPAQLPAARTAALPSGNLYDRPSTRDRVAATPATRDRPRPTPLDAPNEVLTDRSGKVYRPGSGGSWETREDGKWRPAEGLDRPSNLPAIPSTPPTRPAPDARPQPRPAPMPSPEPTLGGATRPQIERDYRSRQRGSIRIESRPSRPAPRPSARPSFRR